MQIDTTELNEQTVWENEFDWAPVAQSTETSIGGVPDIQARSLSYGQPIRLTNGWYSRVDFLALRDMQNSAPTIKRTLTLNDATTHTVVFDIEAGGVTGAPVYPTTNPTADTLYAVTINLKTVEPD
ncbi:MAG: hypothetical protein CMI00_05255 [Oceanospirillaceae bacterium]|nr:hypothetical protein [Oceanospirillaceae bacterium]|tara:strand:- start:452 stop:829 length:378 start_codon:yes stop_codon:yes gene_type:complete